MWCHSLFNYASRLQSCLGICTAIFRKSRKKTTKIRKDEYRASRDEIDFAGFRARRSSKVTVTRKRGQTWPSFFAVLSSWGRFSNDTHRVRYAIVGISTANVAFVSRTNKLPVCTSGAARLVRPARDTRLLRLPLSLSARFPLLLTRENTSGE